MQEYSIGKLEVCNNPIVVFAGRVEGRFLDNVKYLFRHCVLHREPFTCVFLTHSHHEHETLRRAGLRSICFPSEEAQRVLAAAQAVVADDFWWKTNSPVYPALRNVWTLQMWHGVPLKLIGFPEIESGINMSPEKVEHLRFGYSGYDAVLTTSPFVTETSLGRVFQSREVWETGYPRNDVMFRTPDRLDLIGVDTSALTAVQTYKKGGFKVVLYMPTFRDTGGNAFGDGALDLGALDMFGRRNKILFLIKFHPYVDVQCVLDFKAIKLVSPQSDVYPLLPLADCLLTDYSSVAYDFLLTGLPQVFFPYDLEKYLSQDRGMFYPFESMAPGPRPTDQQSLFEALLALLRHGVDEHVAEREELATRLFSHRDGRAAHRVAEHMKARLLS